ncbi:MAG TPA: class I SAM-dependent methyltransferase, partial [Thermoanaerobaculia bacterium]|nr:class I SAM-dependent methyltransferase [Thermoanaerobaculia bacterium]
MNTFSGAPVRSGEAGARASADLARIASGLTLHEDGIWYATRESAVSYPVEGHQTCFQVEEGSFWFAHRNRCITALLSAFPPPAGRPLVDIGGGNGFVSRAIERLGIEAVLVEPGRTGARNAKERGVAHVVCAPLEDAGFAEASFAGAGLFDVIEHLPEPARFLTSLGDFLTEDGRLYVSVPAFPALWSDEDEAAGHYRRYTAATLSATLEASGFTPEFTTFIFRPLPVPVFLLRTIPYRLGRRRQTLDGAAMAREHRAGNRPVRGVVEALLRREASNIERKRPMRFGSSIL